MPLWQILSGERGQNRTVNLLIKSWAGRRPMVPIDMRNEQLARVVRPLGSHSCHIAQSLGCHFGCSSDARSVARVGNRHHRASELGPQIAVHTDESPPSPRVPQLSSDLLSGQAELSSALRMHRDEAINQRFRHGYLPQHGQWDLAMRRYHPDAHPRLTTS